MAKLFELKILNCISCINRHKAANYCELAAEKIGPMEMYEAIKVGGIHPDCPLPDFKESDDEE